MSWMHLNPFSPCMQQPLWGCLLPCSEGTLSVQQPTMMNPINLTSTKVETWWKTLLLGLVLVEEWLKQWETKCKSFQQQEMGDNPNNNLGFLSPSPCTRGTYEASSSSWFFHVFITASLAPKKDHQANRLVLSVLQLLEGSHLMIDKTQLVSGSLGSIGIENTKLLKNLMEFQKVEYDFQYYKMEMVADVQLLIFSEGKSNIIPTDVVVPFQPYSLESSEIPIVEALEASRWYLATVRSLPHSIGSEMQKVVEDDLVEARQADRSIGSRDFSRWMTMAHLVSSSFGETFLSLEHWQMVKELEKLKKRSERFKLPMPKEKDVLAINKMESGALLLAKNETPVNSEIKQ